MILLVAEVQEFKANPNKRARGTVIEAELDKGGQLPCILIQTWYIASRRQLCCWRLFRPCSRDG